MNPIPLLILLASTALSPADPAPRWTQSYAAGDTDDSGACAGGSEIMHLVAHRGKLFAANGYWKDSRWEVPPLAEKQSAQVLRLDSSDGRWQVDLDTGRANDLGLRFMKGNILKSVAFTRDASGAPLSEPQNLLVMAAGANLGATGTVSAWVRDDEAGTWNHSLVLQGSNAGGVRWVPRDMEIHRDQVTGIERLFLLLGNPGIISGVYDPTRPGKIRWDRHPEFPPPGREAFRTRPLGIVRANGSLFFSVGGSIYKRIDGAKPAYTEILNLGDDANTDVGGIRGLTTIPNSEGPGESILFLWAPGGRSISQIKRLDPDGSVHDEANLRDLMNKALGVQFTFTLGAHNMMHPVTHPVTGETVHLIGCQGNIRGRDDLRWSPSPLYAGAMYAVRNAAGTYTMHEVNNARAPGKPPLVSPRTFCLSPFGDGRIFIGGHDASGWPSNDMAWIFKAPLEIALGISPAAAAEPAIERQDSGYQANPTPPTDGLVGSNYTPAFELDHAKGWNAFGETPAVRNAATLAPNTTMCCVNRGILAHAATISHGHPRGAEVDALVTRITRVEGKEWTGFHYSSCSWSTSCAGGQDASQPLRPGTLSPEPTAQHLPQALPPRPLAHVSTQTCPSYGVARIVEGMALRSSAPRHFGYPQCGQT